MELSFGVSAFYFFSLLIFPPLNPISLILFAVVCISNSSFLLLVPSYYLLIYPRRKNISATYNLVLFIFIPMIICIASVTINGIPVLTYDPKILSTLLKGQLQRNQLMKLALDIEQVPFLMLTSIERLWRNIYHRVKFVAETIRPWISSSSGGFNLYYSFTSWVASPWWYLAAQMLPEYANYFRFLLLAIQIVLCTLIYNSISVHNPTIGVSSS